jgi:hypothetical protein
MQIYFFECAGADAAEKLRNLKTQLESLPFIASTRLLQNTKQTDLYLLVVETSEEPHIALPEKTKVWSFKDVTTA